MQHQMSVSLSPNITSSHRHPQATFSVSEVTFFHALHFQSKVAGLPSKLRFLNKHPMIKSRLLSPFSSFYFLSVVSLLVSTMQSSYLDHSCQVCFIYDLPHDSPSAWCQLSSASEQDISSAYHCSFDTVLHSSCSWDTKLREVCSLEWPCMCFVGTHTLVDNFSSLLWCSLSLSFFTKLRLVLSCKALCKIMYISKEYI